MGSNRTYLRVLFFVCVAAGPTLLACEAALDFDRSKIQHYKSNDGAPAADTGPGEVAQEDAGETDTDSGKPDAAPVIKDSGSDADTGT